MNPRQRMLNALAFQPVDKVPLQIHPSPAGLFEHGQKLLDLMRACPHDFDDQCGLSLPVVHHNLLKVLEWISWINRHSWLPK